MATNTNGEGVSVWVVYPNFYMVNYIIDHSYAKIGESRWFTSKEGAMNYITWKLRRINERNGILKLIEKDRETKWNIIQWLRETIRKPI